MGFACGSINDGMGKDSSGIRSLLRPLEQRLRSNNQEEVNSFLDEIDKMANDRFGDAIKKNTELYNTQRDEFFKGLQDRIQPYMGTANESFTGGIQFADTRTSLGPDSLYGNYHASKTILE